MSIQGLVIDDGAQTVYQEIDLGEVFGVDEVPESIKQQVANDLIEGLVKRAQDGLDYNGKKMKKYSDSYVESEVFKAAGKSQSDVNMTLYGDMLAQLDLLEVNGNVIKFGWDSGEQGTKAYAHMTGYKGHPNLDGKVSKRLFFGATAKQIEDAKDKYIDQIATRKDSSANNQSVFDALEILKRADQIQKAKESKSLFTLFFQE